MGIDSEKMIRARLGAVRDRLAQALGQLSEELFVPGVRLTFIARMPGDDDADLVVTADELGEVAKVIERMRGQEVAWPTKRAEIADSHPALTRGLVWCRTCRREQRVDSAECLRSGWPTCCHGHTMTIDHPDTWAGPVTP